jgi:hypothetical protein
MNYLYNKEVPYEKECGFGVSMHFLTRWFDQLPGS